MNVSKKRKYNAGYTLVEIVVVIGIMALFTAIIYSSFDASKAQSRDQKRVSDISSIQLALEQYFQKNGVYPLRLDILVPSYISSIPTDTTNNYQDNYFPLTKSVDTSQCISYQLWTRFEKSNVYLQSRKGFDSTATKLANNLHECIGIESGESNHNKMNASLEINSLVFDVMP